MSKRITMLRHISISVTSSPAGTGDEKQTHRFDAIFTLNLGVFILTFSLNFLMNLLYHAGVAYALALDGWYVIRGETNVGTVVAIISGLSKINDPWGDLATWYRDLAVTGVKYRLIADALKETKRLPGTSDSRDPMRAAVTSVRELPAGWRARGNHPWARQHGGPGGLRTSDRTASGPADDAQVALTSIFFSDFRASADFGSEIVSTPFLKLAAILFVSTSSGSVKERWNEPYRRSVRW